MMNNLMPKIAEMLEYVTIENVFDPEDCWVVSITNAGLVFDSDFYKDKLGKSQIIAGIDLSAEGAVLSYWLRGFFRIKGSFPKDGERVFALSMGDLYSGCRHPKIEEFSFDSKSQFHLLLKDKGLFHETVEEAVKCFEKDYNIYKEMQNVNGVVEWLLRNFMNMLNGMIC